MNELSKVKLFIWSCQIFSFPDEHQSNVKNKKNWYPFSDFPTALLLLLQVSKHLN